MVVEVVAYQSHDDIQRILFDHANHVVALVVVVDTDPIVGMFHLEELDNSQPCNQGNQVELVGIDCKIFFL